MADLPFSPQQYVEQLLNWYGRQGRDLPWRQSRDPYRIWLSEIMLQQTTVAAVRGYYQRFLDNFPTVERLAAAPLEAVIDLWAGLGYYSRARNLHATARILVEEHQGCFPADPQQLQQLPGIGRSTAGAIAALAFERRAAILDGNVRRVLCRLFAFAQPPRSAPAEKQLWAWADLLTPVERVHDYTQAIMDLGATVCTPRQPQCPECPLDKLCQARRFGLEQELPVKQKTKQIPTRHELTLLVEDDRQFLVRRRLTDGFLGGLWEFPCIGLAAEDDAQAKLAQLKADLGVVGEAEPLGEVQHVYSHFRLRSYIYHVRVEQHLLIADAVGCWVQQTELQQLALHGAHKKVLGKLLNHGV